LTLDVSPHSYLKHSSKPFGAVFVSKKEKKMEWIQMSQNDFVSKMATLGVR
jgi:hypothetical protein